jgi:pSer/pThr/pTyr-binding forkhead associated (FHA) protein
VAAGSQSTLIFADGLERPLPAELTIGRDRSCGVILAAKTVSRSHARLYEHNGIWFVEDQGSANGTRVNDQVIPPRLAIRLRHGDRIQVGPQLFLFSNPAELEDDDRTESEVAIDVAGGPVGALSPFQVQVVRVLCEGWLATGNLDRLPTNDEIAARLGTPGAAATVKAALRRIYAKASISDLPPQAKRRALCRIARSHGWI